MTARVALWSGAGKFIRVEPDATRGATVGVDVYNADGSLFVPAAAAVEEGETRLLWSLLLDIPANVDALGEASGLGLFAITGGGTGAMRTLEAGSGAVVNNGAGTAGNPRIHAVDRLASYLMGPSGYLLAPDGSPIMAYGPSTTNLPEGANLYFTEARARDAVIAATITNGDTTHAPSGDAVFDALALKANDSSVVKLSGAQTVAGDKAFTGRISVSDTASWIVTSAGASPDYQIHGTDNNNSSQAWGRFSADGFGNLVYAIKSRSATVGQYTDALVNGDVIYQMMFEGSHGAGLSRGAMLRVVADGTPASGHVPMYFDFYTKNAAGSLTQRFKIGKDGEVIPGQDGTQLLGSASLRWNQVHATSFYANGSKVVGARDTGWAAMTGTGSKATIAAAAAGTASAAYVQAELQAALNRIAALEARLRSLDAALFAHGLIGA